MRKDTRRGTVVERIGRSPRELSRRLSEEGITLSDYVFYGEMYMAEQG
ncbi:hypothetical protein [Pyrodictium abyssi]